MQDRLPQEWCLCLHPSYNTPPIIPSSSAYLLKKGELAIRSVLDHYEVISLHDNGPWLTKTLSIILFSDLWVVSKCLVFRQADDVVDSLITSCSDCLFTKIKATNYYNHFCKGIVKYGVLRNGILQNVLVNITLMYKELTITHQWENQPEPWGGFEPAPWVLRSTWLKPLDHDTLLCNLGFN